MGSSWSVTTVRHGETDYNAANRYAGLVDIPLNARGREDACKASAALRRFSFDVVLVSPLRRAWDTARLLLDGHPDKGDVVLAPAAQERNYGRMQTLTGQEIERFRPPVNFIRMGDDYHSVNPPDGESLEELRARASAFWQDILARYAGKRVLVVSHGTFLQQLHGVIRGQDWIEALASPVRNLELTTFTLEGKELRTCDRLPLGSGNDSSW